ncbi:DUF1631 domain-containing protein [Pseudomonas zhanjiangensis]|uniref:DUF1631 domain-containing protein n=1 Tax=Pseudomonas zhanjiangensis TaxID=3239015 RepID=A0ABV3YUA9_9PSED
MSTQDQPPHTGKPGTTLASRGIQPRFGELAQSCRQLVMNSLAEHLGQVFGQVDDTLFECADKAESNQLQSLFFDSMREIRKLRPKIERSYLRAVAQNFTDFFQGTLKPATSAGDLEAERLSLIENEEYEEALQIINMVSRVKARCAQPLYALEQRLALLNNGTKLSEDGNPFGPQMIAQAFREALTPCPLPLRIKIILYSLFDQHVMRGLDNLYAALNQRLIDAGILPNLKPSIRRSASTPPAANPPASRPVEETPLGLTPPPAGTPSSEATPASAAPPNLGGPPPSDPSALLSSLSALLGEHRRHAADAPLLGGTPSISSFAPRGATRTYSASELLEALNRMQRQSAEDLAQRMRNPQRVEGLKSDLQQQLDSHSPRPGEQKLSDQEADTIDLVGMLFDFILDDTCLADCYKTALSHLHTPYLKVALQDKELFTQHQHPARRLLNALAQAGVMYGEGDEERGLLSKMQWVVERVINGFSGDLLLFEALHEELDQYTQTLQHKVELRERRAVEAAKGRDRLLSARQQALEVIAGCLEQREPPPIIRNFLELTWTDVLVFILLRQGAQSGEWQRACEVAEQLAWSGTLLDEAERERLQALRVPLLEDLRKGLQLLGGYHEDGIRRLLQDLVACQHAVQAKQPQLAAKLNPPLAASTFGSMFEEDAGEPAQPELSSTAKQLSEQLMHIEFGTWFEFDENGQTRTLKLSWFSPTTRNYMFVDHSGQRVAIKPLAQLAREMEQGQARIVSDERNSPLMDRALTAIYRVLQRFTGRAATPR